MHKLHNISQVSLDNLSLDSGEDMNQKNRWFYDLPAHSIKVDMQNSTSEKDFKNLKSGEFKLCLDCSDMLLNIKQSSNETVKVAHAVQEQSISSVSKRSGRR